MVWGEYVEKELISKRFILAVGITAGYILAPGVIPAEIFGVVIGFYFGSHTPALAELITETKA